MPAPKKPQDHKAAKSEAKSEDISVDFDGYTYTLPREVMDDIEVFERIEDEKYITAVRQVLGPDQWQHFKDSHRNESGRVSPDAFEQFLDSLMGAMGGNS